MNHVHCLQRPPLNTRRTGGLIERGGHRWLSGSALRGGEGEGLVCLDATASFRNHGKNHTPSSFYYSPFVGWHHAVASSSLPPIGRARGPRERSSIVQQPEHRGDEPVTVTMAGRPPCCQLAMASVVRQVGTATGLATLLSLLTSAFHGAFRVVHTAYFRLDI
jgi:hypothetical protein